ncbi:AMP-binding protein [Rhodococcoides corynebacterioides]|uniref:AMP-binding protein n=1 Tax=Rhodococcoides corynebacterioides TaxID=53972 RepID=UPI0027DFAD69|nr:AMP-binding protein [Rhodococcus corynebacterioides]
MIGEPIDARIGRWARDRPDGVALVDATRSTTYRELWEASGRAAGRWVGDRRTAVLPSSDVGSVAAVLGAIRAGSSVLLLHRHLTADRLASVLAVGGPREVVAAPRLHARLRRLGYAGPLVTPSDAARGRDAALPSVDESAELLAGLTSGTSGRPKVFVRSRSSWSRTLDRSDEEFTIDADARVATPGVLDHTHFLYGVIHALGRGAAVDLRPLSAGDGAGADPTHLYTVPTLAVDVVAGLGGPLRSVREVLSSGAFWPEPARASLAARLPGARVVHFYGASELSLVSVAASDDAVPAGSSGRVVSGVDVRIDDGVVHVRSDMLFDGYLTDESSLPVDGPVDGWFDVGDRGRVEGRWLFLSGRVSDTISRGALKVEPADVERALLSYPGVVEAACVGAPHPRMGAVPVAAIVTDGPVDRAALRRHLRTSLDVPSRPTRVVVTDALPRTPRGKLDRSAVPALIDRLS